MAAPEEMDGRRQDDSMAQRINVTEGRPPLPRMPTAPLPWETLVSEIKSEVKELRRAVENRSQRLSAVEKGLRAKVEENANIVLEVQQLDRKIEEESRRKKQLHILAAAARKRKAQLQADMEEAKLKLNSLSECHQEANKTEANTERVQQSSVSTLLDGATRTKLLHAEAGVHEVPDLQRKLYNTRARCRKLCSENEKLGVALAAMNAEENASECWRNEVGNSESNESSHLEFKAALWDLINSFEHVTRAASVSE